VRPVEFGRSCKVWPRLSPQRRHRPDADVAAGRSVWLAKQRFVKAEEHDSWTTTETALTQDLSVDLQDARERPRETCLCPPIAAPKALVPAIAHGLRVPDFSSGKRFLYTLSMSEQAELFEIRFSVFNGPFTEGM
jgi:hypothetical protein